MSYTDSDIDSTALDDAVLASGSIIDGKYVIKGLLGRGGNGSVYEAEHATIGHRVAIKLVNPSRLQREDSLVRFQREAKICGAIRHPHVGQIYDVGTLEDGTPFMVMELHEGRSLGAVLDESVLPIAAIIEVARQLLSGLAAVHHAGAVHRDVKPDNAMLVRASSGDLVVKLVDFGISKVVRPDIRERALTREDIVIGSPDYMSPEQLRGQEVDVRTDLYGVGVLLYEAVTGGLPFDAENLTDLMAAIVRDPVRPPSQLRTDCPAELEHVILKAMSRAPADRFQSADEMSRQLAHVQRTVRYATDPGLARLQEPMPPRDARTRRTRGFAGGFARSASAASSSAPPALVTKSAGKRSFVLPLIIGACVVLGLGLLAVRSTLDGRDRAERPTPGRAVTSPPYASARAVPTRTQDSVVPGVAAAAGAAASSATGSLIATPSEIASTEPAAAAEVLPKPLRRAPADSRRVRDRRANARAVEATDSAAVAGEKEGAPDTRALLDEAASAFVLGQMPRARSLYQQVLDRQPTQPDAWRGLGLAASRIGQRQDAERAFERYLKLRPNAPDAARIRELLEKLRE